MWKRLKTGQNKGVGSTAISTVPRGFLFPNCINTRAVLKASSRSFWVSLCYTGSAHLSASKGFQVKLHRVVKVTFIKLWASGWEAIWGFMQLLADPSVKRPELSAGIGGIDGWRLLFHRKRAQIHSESTKGASYYTSARLRINTGLHVLQRMSPAVRAAHARVHGERGVLAAISAGLNGANADFSQKVLADPPSDKKIK